MILLAAFGLASASSQGAPVTINFDTDVNWTAGSGAISSYQSDHTYSESGWLFTGGPALRNTSTDQDGFAGALGTYSWRLRDATGVSWTATFTQALGAGEYFSNFGFDARRWDGSPDPGYTVSYSVNGGGSFTTATSIGSSGVINNAALGNSSDWSSFSQSFTSPTALAANQFVVKIERTTGERLMVDNFTATTIPEPSTIMLMGLIGIAAVMLLHKRK